MADLLALRFMDEYPEAAAAAINDLDAIELSDLLHTVPIKTSARFIQFIPPAKVAQCLARLPLQVAADLVSALPYSVVTPIMQLMDQSLYTQLMEVVPVKTYTTLRLIQRFPEGSVGAVLDAALALPHDLNVELALRRIRANSQFASHVVFVVDANHKLVGRIAIHDLVQARRKTKLESIAVKKIPTFSCLARLSEVEQHPAWTKDTVVAVTNRKGVLLGVLKQDRMVHVLSEQAPASHTQPMADTLFGLAYLLWSALILLLFPRMEKTPADKEVDREE